MIQSKVQLLLLDTSRRYACWLIITGVVISLMPVFQLLIHHSFSQILILRVLTLFVTFFSVRSLRTGDDVKSKKSGTTANLQQQLRLKKRTILAIRE